MSKNVSQPIKAKAQALGRKVSQLKNKIAETREDGEALKRQLTVALDRAKVSKILKKIK